MINKMVMVMKLGKMALNILDNISRGRSMGMEYLNLMMEAIMKENFLKMIFVVKENTIGKMGKYTKDNGNTIK